MIENFQMFISEFNSNRTIRVHLPELYYETDKRFPVLYLQDGKNVFQIDEENEGHSLELEAYLEEERHNVIVVAVDQDPTERRNEYCPWPNGEYSKKLLADERLSFGGRGHAYAEFLVRDLKPDIDKKYRTLPDEAGIGGISLGGLIAVYTAFRYPLLFKNITILSPAFYANREEIEKMADAADVSAIHSFYMDCGTAEGPTPYIQQEFLENSRSFYAILKKKMPLAQFKEIEGGEHDYTHFKKRRGALFAYLEGESSLFN